jgi:hypothetical protein
MRDLELFRMLRTPEEGEGGRLAELLESLAVEPIGARVPFFGFLERAIAHDDARVRAAALAVLAGAEGALAYPAMVSRLDDGDPGVRVSALAALRESATSQPARWAHALFHSDPEIRRLAVEGGGPQATASWSFYLLADEACAAAVRGKGVAVPPGGLPALTDFAARGLVSRDDARRLIADIPYPQLASWVATSHQRTMDDAKRVLEATTVPTSSERDVLDELFALFLAEDADEAVRDTFFAKLESGLFGANLAMRWRVVASLLLAFARLGWYLPLASGICAVFHPSFLTCAWVPRDVRYTALARVYANGRRVPRITDPELEKLVRSDLGLSRKGGLDLWALGAILHFARGNPYQTLLEWVKEDEIAVAFAADMGKGASFLVLADDSPKGRKYLMRVLAERVPSERGQMFALLVETARADELEFLDTLDDDVMGQALASLIVLEERPGIDLAHNKVKRLGETFSVWAQKGGPERIASALLEPWLSRPDATVSKVALATFGALARALETADFVSACRALETPRLKKLLDALPFASEVPYGKEVALACSLLGHVSPAVHRWAAERIPASGGSPPARRAPEGVVELGADAERRIVDAAEHELDDAVAPCLRAPHRGLTGALARRLVPVRAHPAVCAALVGAHDPILEVARELDRHLAGSASTVTNVDARSVDAWQSRNDLPLHGHAWLHRFEHHAFALANGLAADGGGRGVANGLAGALSIPNELLRVAMWRGVMRAFEIWRWRDAPRLGSLACEELLDLAVAQLDTEVGEPAARIIVAFHEARLAGELLAARRERVKGMLADLSDETRRHLRPFMEATGLPSRTVPARVRRAMPDDATLAAIRSSDDLDALEAHCRDDDPKIVHEAALRLIELGELGLARLVDLLCGEPPVAHAIALADGIALFPDGASVARLHAFLASGGGRPELRFRVALGLAERGDRDVVPHAFRAASVEEDAGWLRATDHHRLSKLVDDRRALAIALAESPHPHAYRNAVEALLEIARATRAASTPIVDEEVLAALRAFLERGTERILDLRRRAARALLDEGDTTGYPVVVSAVFQERTPELPPALVRVAPDLVASIAEACLFAGPKLALESRVIALAEHGDTDRLVRDAILERMLHECTLDSVRQGIVSGLARRPSRSRKLAAVADVFAWGVREGRTLTGRIFRFHMIGGQGLGYTRLDSNHIHVSPTPMLSGDRHGREVVEALVLHEIGHHIHHRGKEEAEVWKKAQADGVGGLLNLVADEHLERNLRALDATYGDRLKRLAAYAFQHTDRDVAVQVLLEMLQGRAFEVLTAITLGVARRPDAVRVSHGPLLAEMEKAGMRFAKFVRALRMGLGKRHGDALVDEALEMFGKAFRKGDMQSLLAITYRLRELFGDETRIVETFGGHEALGDDARDRIIHGEGIDDDEVQREVERVLDPRAASQSGGPSGRGGKLLLNVNPNERFDVITEVKAIPPDPEKHRAVGATVARLARNMRRFLHDLGLALEPRRFRLRGRRFDTGRTTAVVTRGDPRMLITRELTVTTDLFLGVVVDCSGSMHGRSMERARAFGVLLADAAKGLPGIDVRFFGFTDRIIYDAGDAAHPAVASLEAGGGNNDAAALFHVAQVARRSRRRAKLLVMISDGLPTECSVAALKALVTRLVRKEGMLCAQVAVRPIEEVCFPHYVEVNEEDYDAAVRRFGTIIAKLVRKAMAA